VTAKSAVEYMLYHQNSLAQVNSGSRLRAASHSFSPPTRRLDWRHSQISDRSRKYQPLPTMPCSRGSAPVTKVDCTVVVTAGTTVSSGRTPPRFASALRFGACASSTGVRPATFSTSVRFMAAPVTDREKSAAAAPATILLSPPLLRARQLRASIDCPAGACAARGGTIGIAFCNCNSAKMP
jgi:hypothetical protein